MSDEDRAGLRRGERGVILAIALLLGLAGAAGAARTGWIERALVERQILSTRRAWPAIDTVGDYEVARAVAFAQLGQLEGMHGLAPADEDGLFLLVRGWASATFAFIEDDMEQAEDAEGGRDAFRYHRARAVAGYARAIGYGISLLERRRPGFEAAKRNDETMGAWLAGFDDPARDAPALFWTGYAWMARVHVSDEDPAAVAELFVGVAMMERVVALDPSFEHGMARALLGAYHARSAMAELDAAKRDLDAALAVSGGRFHMVKLLHASTYLCVTSDRDGYVRVLSEIEAAGDVLPEQRLSNAIAARRARRYLGAARLKACGF